jgi:hypothetical protein
MANTTRLYARIPKPLLDAITEEAVDVGEPIAYVVRKILKERYFQPGHPSFVHTHIAENMGFSLKKGRTANKPSAMPIHGPASEHTVVAEEFLPPSPASSSAPGAAAHPTLPVSYRATSQPRKKASKK